MGGDRPADLEHDEYTWVDLGDLVNRGGYSQHEAASIDVQITPINWGAVPPQS
jgi:hypothetical protein